MVKISETLSLVHQTMRCHEWGSCIFGVKDAKQLICKQLWWKIALMHYCQQHMEERFATNGLKDCRRGCCSLQELWAAVENCWGWRKAAEMGTASLRDAVRPPWADFIRICKIPELILLGPAKTLSWFCLDLQKRGGPLLTGFWLLGIDLG